MTQFKQRIHNYFYKLFFNKSFLLWNILFFLALFAFIFMVTSDLVGYKWDGNPNNRQVWQEHIYMWLKFTLISNLFCAIVSFITIINLMNYKNQHLQRLKILMTVNLTITMLIFWTVIFPGRGFSYYNPVSFTSTIFAHVIVPVFAIITFLVEIWLTRSIKNNGLNIWITALINLSFLLIWFLMAIFVYYGFGASKKDSIYSFIAFDQKQWYISLLLVLFVGFSYFGFTVLFSWLYKK